MAILKLKPSCKEYLWGGRKLIEEFGKEFAGEKLAETWELSCHKNGPSMILNGEFAGKTLQEYVEENGKEVLGKNCEKFDNFPILIKFIDAKDNLSIQVHPDNAYALREEGQYGKTEMWYVVDAEPSAFLYYGFSRAVSKEEFAERIRSHTLLEVLNQVPVKKGDVFFIEAGTIHAIGKGILIAEIQQNSDVTYRVYDYGRVGADHKPRELHIEQAVEVTNTAPVTEKKEFGSHLGVCEYFTVDKLDIQKEYCKRMTTDSFCSLLVLEGEGSLFSGEETAELKKGDSIFMNAADSEFRMEGHLEILMTTVGK